MLKDIVRGQDSIVLYFVTEEFPPSSSESQIRAAVLSLVYMHILMNTLSSFTSGVKATMFLSI